MSDYTGPTVARTAEVRWPGTGEIRDQKSVEGREPPQPL